MSNTFFNQAQKESRRTPKFKVPYHRKIFSTIMQTKTVSLGGITSIQIDLCILCKPISLVGATKLKMFINQTGSQFNEKKINGKIFFFFQVYKLSSRLTCSANHTIPDSSLERARIQATVSGLSVDGVFLVSNDQRHCSPASELHNNNIK